jgi:hypothetical protein
MSLTDKKKVFKLSTYQYEQWAIKYLFILYQDAEKSEVTMQMAC